jgi:hypothetical protein
MCTQWIIQTMPCTKQRTQVKCTQGNNAYVTCTIQSNHDVHKGSNTWEIYTKQMMHAWCAHNVQSNARSKAIMTCITRLRYTWWAYNEQGKSNVHEIKHTCMTCTIQTMHESSAQNGATSMASYTQRGNAQSMRTTWATQPWRTQVNDNMWSVHTMQSHHGAHKANNTCVVCTQWRDGMQCGDDMRKKISISHNLHMKQHYTSKEQSYTRFVE